LCASLYPSIFFPPLFSYLPAPSHPFNPFQTDINSMTY
jgi:hypothetical protein